MHVIVAIGLLALIIFPLINKNPLLVSVLSLTFHSFIHVFTP